VWFASGADAGYLAEDRVRFGHDLRPSLRVQTPLAGGLELNVGDVVSWSDSHFGMSARPFRVVEQSIHLDDGRVELLLEEARRRPWEPQDSVSSLNLNLRTLTAIGSASWLALTDELGTDRLVRRDGEGVFQPVGPRGTALLVLGGGELLLGGPPNAGGFQAVLQRSSDAGSSAVVVSSLAPNVDEVHDLFEVRSGTVLASVNSGGIWRSTDAGSSWSPTQAVSGAYHIQQFFRPYSGTLWGGTGQSEPLFAHGLHIWESQNEGVSWTPRHVVQTSDSYAVGGWFHLSDSEWLLGQYGDFSAKLAVLRGRAASPTSVSWTVVRSGASFARMLRTDSNHLLCGFHEDTTLLGGTVYRSVDQGSSWVEDARLAKRGNIALLRNGDGTLDAFVARMTVGPRTDRHRNHQPDELT
jgi:hypothetical protein